MLGEVLSALLLREMSRPYEHTKRRRSASADSIGQAGYIEAQRFTSSPAGADGHAAVHAEKNVGFGYKTPAEVVAKRYKNP